MGETACKHHLDIQYLFPSPTTHRRTTLPNSVSSIMTLGDEQGNASDAAARYSKRGRTRKAAPHRGGSDFRQTDRA
jgi:hypothetical protein